MRKKHKEEEALNMCEATKQWEEKIEMMLST